MEPQKEFWNIDVHSAALLQALIHTHQPKEILEIGTSNGYSAIQMGRIAKQYGGHITTVEFFEGRVTLAKENIKKEGLSETIEVVQGDAIEILSNFARGSEQHFDFIFIDANKEEYVLYFQHAMKIITNKGIIVSDNTMSHAKKLSEFFMAVQKEPRVAALELPIGAGLMVLTVH